ncbi:hypothetical protein B0T22DRAFT_385300, partial [Podospora appendiculata]
EPVRLPSTPTLPERPKARPRKQGTDHRHSLYSQGTKAVNRRLCRQTESKMVLTVGRRGYCSSTRVGSVAPLGNTKGDNYYRNDSPGGKLGVGLLKYCRHEEKRKRKRNGRGPAENIYRWVRSVRAAKLLGGPGWQKSFSVGFGRRFHCQIGPGAAIFVLPGKTAKISRDLCPLQCSLHEHRPF